MNATDPTFSPAVERAAELLIREAETTGLIRDDVRNGLAVALDVDEMARAAYNAMFDASRWPSWSRLEPHERIVWIQHAKAMRDAILGPES